MFNALLLGRQGLDGVVLESLEYLDNLSSVSRSLSQLNRSRTIEIALSLRGFHSQNKKNRRRDLPSFTHLNVEHFLQPSSFRVDQAHLFERCLELPAVVIESSSLSSFSVLNLCRLVVASRGKERGDGDFDCRREQV